MVPQAIVILDAFPLTANGKLDRARLPDLRHALAGSSPKSAETSGMEGVVAEVWRASLAHEDIGFDENFFDVGGNSVRLIAVHRALEARIGRRIPIVELFQHPTIRSLGVRLATLAQVAPTAQGSADQQLSEGRRRLVALQRRRMAGPWRAEAQRSDDGSGRPSGLKDNA
jgi:aryl carrier-like protein